MSKYHSKPFTQTKLFGVVGLLLAVPVAVCIKTTLDHYYAEPIASPYAVERAASRSPEPGQAPR